MSLKERELAALSAANREYEHNLAEAEAGCVRAVASWQQERRRREELTIARQETLRYAWQPPIDHRDEPGCSASTSEAEETGWRLQISDVSASGCAALGALELSVRFTLGWSNETVQTAATPCQERLRWPTETLTLAMPNKSYSAGGDWRSQIQKYCADSSSPAGAAWSRMRTARDDAREVRCVSP